MSFEKVKAHRSVLLGLLATANVLACVSFFVFLITDHQIYSSLIVLCEKN